MKLLLAVEIQAERVGEFLGFLKDHLCGLGGVAPVVVGDPIQGPGYPTGKVDDERGKPHVVSGLKLHGGYVNHGWRLRPRSSAGSAVTP